MPPHKDTTRTKRKSSGPVSSTPSKHPRTSVSTTTPAALPTPGASNSPTAITASPQVPQTPTPNGNHTNGGQNNGAAQSPAVSLINEVDSQFTSSVEEAPKIPAKGIQGLNRPTEKVKVYVCGTGIRGELGIGATEEDDDEAVIVAKMPVLNPNLDIDTVGVVQIAVGLNHAAALTYDGKVLTWGSNLFGTLGRITEPTDTEKKWAETRPKNQSTQRSASLGDSVQVPIRGEKEVELEVGDDRVRVLGMMDVAELNRAESIPDEVDFEGVLLKNEEIVQICATDHATFTLTNRGRVFGFGIFMDDNGALGFSKSKITSIRRGKTKIHSLELIANLPTPADTPPLIISMATGSNHLVLLDASGNVHALGAGSQGQLARRLVNRFQYEALQSRQIGITKKVSDIISGGSHSFAVSKDGRIYAWGLNNYEQTGVLKREEDEPGENGGLQVITPEVINVNDELVLDIAGGIHHSIACTTSGSVFTWGRCDEAQSGIPREILDDGEPEDFDADDKGHYCISYKKNVVEGIPGARRVFAGRDNCYVIDENGALWAWGHGNQFQTGLGRTEETPQKVVGEIGEGVVKWVQTRGSVTFIGVEREQ